MAAELVILDTSIWIDYFRGQIQHTLPGSRCADRRPGRLLTPSSITLHATAEQLRAVGRGGVRVELNSHISFTTL